MTETLNNPLKGLKIMKHIYTEKDKDIAEKALKDAGFEP